MKENRSTVQITKAAPVTRDPIVQDQLPHLAWLDPRTARLPGIQPVVGDDWLRVDDAFAGQMRERDRLIAQNEMAVHALMPSALPAALELFERVLQVLRCTPGYTVTQADVRRPDGVTVPLDDEAPLRTLGRLIQEDLCLMEQVDDEHVLTGAILCFPASWTLAQKLGRPMTAIHIPVEDYTDDVAQRVQRMFNAIRPEQPLWRMNYLTYADPTLHQPRLEFDRRPRPPADVRVFVRSERQCLMRLPLSRAVVFSIHTYVVRSSALPDHALAALRGAGL